MTCFKDARAIASLFAVILSACAGPTSSSVDAAYDRDSGSDHVTTNDASSPDVAVGTPDAGLDAANPPAVFAVPSRCDFDAGEAPLPIASQTRGQYECITVGATRSDLALDWPVSTGARLPLVFVDPHAAPGGTGSMSQPFVTIEEAISALETRGNGTIVLHRGDHSIAGPITLSHDLALLGVAGSNGSSIVLASGATGPAFQVSGPLTLSLSGVQLNKVTRHVGPMIAAWNGASVTLRDVDIELSDQGFVAFPPAGMTGSDGAHLDAQQLTIRDSTGAAIEFHAAGDAVVRSLFVRGGSAGVQSIGANLTLGEVLVHQAQRGLYVNSSATTSVRLDRVATIGSQWVGGSFAGAALTVDAAQLMVAGTTVDPTHAGSGAGLVVANGATFNLDVSVNSDATQGRASQIVANAGTGVIVTDHGHGVFRGALVASNGAGGMAIQDHAFVNEVGYGFFTDNLGIGMLITTAGSLAGLVCNGFTGNLAGTVAFQDHTMQTFEDGVVNTPGEPGHAIVIAGNLFSLSPRFGLLCVAVNVTLMDNVFDSNGYAWGIYDDAMQSQSANNTDRNNTSQAPNALADTGLTGTPGSLAIP